MALTDKATRAAQATAAAREARRRFLLAASLVREAKALRRSGRDYANQLAEARSHKALAHFHRRLADTRLRQALAATR